LLALLADQQALQGRTARGYVPSANEKIPEDDLHKTRAVDDGRACAAQPDETNHEE